MAEFQGVLSDAERALLLAIDGSTVEPRIGVKALLVSSGPGAQYGSLPERMNTRGLVEILKLKSQVAGRRDDVYASLTALGQSAVLGLT